MNILFNKLPFIDTSNSDNFKKRAEMVIKNDIPNWTNFLSREYNPDEYNEELDEDSILNTLISSETIRNKSVNPNFIPILTELFKNVKIYTNKDLLAQIEKSCVSINKIPGELIGIVELTGFKKYNFKSKEWILHQTMSCLTENKVTKLIKAEELINLDSKTFLMMDDAMYSGTQNVFLIKSIVENNKFVTIYLFVMYAAEVGISLLTNYFKWESIFNSGDFTIFTLGTNKVYLWNGYTLLESTLNILNKINSSMEQNNTIYDQILEKAGSLTVFEHKIPDFKSLPWIISNVFYISMPEYFINTPVYSPISRNFSNFIENKSLPKFNVNFGKQVYSDYSDYRYLKRLKG
jgi:hypothetical protein